eukprot:7290408-Lingulodinium_polyedra.AAC.1
MGYVGHSLPAVSGSVRFFSGGCNGACCGGSGRTRGFLFGAPKVVPGGHNGRSIRGLRGARPGCTRDPFS